MSLPPQIRRILTPPPVIPSASLQPSSATAIASLAARTHLEQCVRDAKRKVPKAGQTQRGVSAAAGTATDKPVLQQVQRVVTLHPCLPLVAYLLEDAPTNANYNPSHKIITVQDLNTQQIIFNLHWMDLAACLYGEENAQKLVAATKTLGTLLHMSFLDASTLYWSGMMTHVSNDKNNNSHQLQHLLLQTTTRCIILNMTPSRYSSVVLWSSPQTFTNQLARHLLLASHVHQLASGGGEEATSGDKQQQALPSSNLLPLTEQLCLVGCTDGSLKCYNWVTQQVRKSIKGLGKNDWIVHLVAANAYASCDKKRILTLTKKGSCYLIELEWDGDDTAAHNLELKPPLARFVGGTAEGLDSDAMEHDLFHYDAHRDWILWMAPATKKQPTTLLVWNLKLLNDDFVKNQTSGNKTLLQPDPTLTVQFPGAEDTSITVLPTLNHGAFPDDAVVCAVATASGEFFLQAAVAHPKNTVSVAGVTAVLGVGLGDLLEHEASLDSVPVIRVHAIRAQPLGERPMVVVASNLGLLVLDLPNTTFTGARHLHFGAGHGSMGKSLLLVQHSEIIYASLDVLKVNPVGLMSPKNPVIVHESSAAMHMPPEYHKRPFRLVPNFLPSPSGLYVALMWPTEFRYEVLHIPSLLARVGQQRGSGGQLPSRNPVVACGTGIASFAWIGDDDTYAILHARDLMEASALLIAAATYVPAAIGESSGGMGIMNVAHLATGVTMSATKAVGGATKAVSGATLNATKLATGATKAAASMTLGATSVATKKTVKGLKKGAKVATFGLFSKKKNKNEDDGETDGGVSFTTQGDLSEEGASLAMMQPGQAMPGVGVTAPLQSQGKKRIVELRTLVAIESSEVSGTIAAANSSAAGELTLRGGARNLPTVLYGGPVLCVASAPDGNEKGHAHFYTRKPDETENTAAVYVSSGPTLPYPELCCWDDDGLLCAIVLENRVAIYLSHIPEFVLLGTVRIGSKSRIQNVRFVHGVLFCCTWNSIYCVFLGDLEGGVCKIDSYCLASSFVPALPDPPLNDDEYCGLAPPCIPMALVQPYVLGYQNGSLIVSTARGVYAVPLAHPLLRIGSLLAAQQVERAAKWFDAIPDYDHEALASFLERRGHHTLAMKLPGLSLETIVDMCMRYGDIGRLEEVVQEYGVNGLRAIDMGRGVSSSIFGPERTAHSVVVCVGAYLLAHGAVELTRLLATELLRSGEDGKRDALFLATLLLSVDEADASRLMRRAVERKNGVASDWIVGSFVRDHIVNN
jgi:hypothetical protein